MPDYGQNNEFFQENNMKKSFAILIMTCLTTACSEPPNSAANSPAQSNPAGTPSIASPASAPRADSAENSLDWMGEYKGTLPCADCEGIETDIELSADKSYEITEKYLGEASVHDVKMTGEFRFDPKQTSIIVLETSSGTRRYFVGENFIELRDSENGDKLVTQLNYRLEKVKDSSAQNLD